MADGFDLKELDMFADRLTDLANKRFPKETKKFLNNEAKKLNNKNKQNAKSKVGKKSGNYMKGFKKGKPYKYINDEFAVRSYNSSPHAHLVEYGHIQTDHEGNEVGFVEGKHVMENTAKSFENEYFNDVETFIGDLLDKGL